MRMGCRRGTLIKHGANVNVQNKEGHQSADDVSLRDKQGKTALDEAKAWNRSEKVIALQTGAQARKQ
jgi:ankyrin repeat protein